MNPNIIIGGGIAALSALGIGFIGYRKLSLLMPYLYANARVQAKSAFAISSARKQELAAKTSLKEFISSLNGTDYSGIDVSSSLKQLHSALEISFIASADELKRMTPASFSRVVDAYLKFYEAKIIKAFYRSRFFSDNSALDESLVFPVGSLDSAVLQRLSATKTVADIHTVMSSGSYSYVFSKQYESIDEFEISLDNFVLSEIKTTLDKSDLYDKKHIQKALNLKFDMINLSIIAKCIVRGYDKSMRRSLLVMNNGELANKLEKISMSSSLEELVSSAKGTFYSKALEEALAEYSKDGMLYHFEVLMNRHFINYLSDSTLLHMQGPYPLFVYLLSKEIEVKNLLAMSKGIDAGIEKDEIMRMVV